MKTWIKILSLPLFLSCSLAQAVEAGGVTIGGTRLIYEGSKKEASLNVTNSDVSPY
ncbi:TPA: molecular chaperone, partial [Enterobacter asburiae]|nr:molecular chaperone [Enterobacter asburiae]